MKLILVKRGDTVMIGNVVENGCLEFDFMDSPEVNRELIRNWASQLGFVYADKIAISVLKTIADEIRGTK